jgi:hypothetical protein
MAERTDRNEPDAAEKPRQKERGVSHEHAGNKPRLTDAQALAELLRRQREREH